MKSSGHKTVASKFVTVVGLTLALALGFFVVNQGSYTAKGEGEKVLGANSYNTTTVSKLLNGVNYLCKKTDCEQALVGGGQVPQLFDITMNYGNHETPELCRSIKDRSNRSVCYWSNPTFTTAQCNVDKTFYRNKKYKNNLDSVGGRNQALGGSENVVYYDCVKITPTPRPTCNTVGVACCSGGNSGSQGTTSYCQGGLTCISGKCRTRPTDPKPTGAAGNRLPSTR